MRILTVVAGFILGACVLARGDIITLDDGTKLEGQAKRTANGWTITTNTGVEISVKLERIASIDVTRDNSAPESSGAEKLDSLRRVVGNMSDIHQIIDRYDKFIKQNANSSVMDDANKDLLLWHDRLDQGLVKIAAKWVTPDERDQIQASSQAESLQARDLIRQSRYREATPFLQKALAEDPENATAFYLRGVMLYNQGQVSQAKKDFDAVNAILPNYAPSLNNLAIIAWRQKSYVGAMNYYDQAMLAAPLAKQVLDNVAEALHALPDENKQAPAVKKCAADFKEQDTALQRLAAKDGWFRWGSSWVTAKELDALKAAEAKIQDQLDALTKQGQDIKDKMDEANGEITSNLNEIHRLQAASVTYDGNGNQIQMPLPRAYYDLMNDNTKLADSLKTMQKHFDDLGAQYKQVQASLPTPEFSGNQSIIGLDAAPQRGQPPPSAGVPTTQPEIVPATQPALPALPDELRNFGPATQP